MASGSKHIEDQRQEGSSGEEEWSKLELSTRKRSSIRRQPARIVEGGDEEHLCDATGRQEDSMKKWFNGLADVDRETVDWTDYEPEPKEDEHVVTRAKCARCDRIRNETFVVARASMLYWDKAGAIPNPVPWCNPCVNDARTEELQRLFEEDKQDAKQFTWSQARHIKMDVRALKTA